MNNSSKLGGMYWTCSECGELIIGSSIIHDCVPFKETAEKFFGKLLKGKEEFIDIMENSLSTEEAHQKLINKNKDINEN